MPIYAWILIGLGGLWLLMVMRIMTATSEAPASAAKPIEINGKAQKLEGQRYLEYRVGVDIRATPDVIWGLLTDAAKFPSWNSTIISIDGTIAEGQKIDLKAKVAPDRTFTLSVSKKTDREMVWQDGNRIFKGVRTFTLEPTGDGVTRFTMAEVMTGAFLPQIAPKLPDFAPAFDAFAADLKKAAQA